MLDSLRTLGMDVMWLGDNAQCVAARSGISGQEKNNICNAAKVFRSLTEVLAIGAKLDIKSVEG